MQLKSSDMVGRDRSRQKDTVVGFMGEATDGTQGVLQGTWWICSWVDQDCGGILNGSRETEVDVFHGDEFTLWHVHLEAKLWLWWADSWKRVRGIWERFVHAGHVELSGFEMKTFPSETRGKIKMGSKKPRGAAAAWWGKLGS